MTLIGRGGQYESHNTAMPDDGCAPACSDWRGMSPEEMEMRIREFLIATTMKDCSIMVTIQRCELEGQEASNDKHKRTELFDPLSMSWYQVWARNMQLTRIGF